MLQKGIIFGSAAFIQFAILADIFGWLRAFPYRLNGSLNEVVIYLVLLATIVIMVVGFTANSAIAFKWWWKLARYTLPIAAVATVAVALGILHTDNPGSGYGWSGFLDPLVDTLALGLIYVLFFVTSVVQIIRGYDAGKRWGAEE